MSTSRYGGWSTLATCLRIIWGHRIYLAIYLVALSFMAVFVAMGSVPDYSSEAAASARPEVAIVDRDHSAVSQGVATFVADRGTVVEIADTKRALQDAVAEGRVAYILIIPEGYGEALVEAAHAAEDAPTLETVVSYSSASGSLVDIQVVGYLQAIYGFASTLGADQARAVELANEATAQDALAGIAQTQDGPPALRLYVYLTFSTYPLFAAVSLCIALLMRSLNESAVRQRTLVAPTHTGARSLQVLIACVLLGVVAWVWIMVVGLVFFGTSMLVEDPARMGVVALALLAYALFATAVGFLLGQLGVGEQAANMVANVGGLLLSFLGGAWISASLMPSEVVAVAHFTPAYWMVQAADALLLRQSAVLEGLGDAGLVVVFAVAVCTVALAVGRARVREA